MIAVDAAQFGTPTGWPSETRARAHSPTIGLRAGLSTAPQKNNFLAALPAEVQGRIFPHLAPVSWAMGEVLYECGAVQRDVYFPIDSFVALLYCDEDGGSAEVSLVGNEGLVGLPSLLGGHSSPWGVVVQGAGRAYRLSGERLKAEIGRDSEVLSLMLRYTQSLLTQISQNAVCNRHHSIDQQVCRWLLRCLDRQPTAEIVMTQEVMASMLGVRREGVTVAAAKLKKLGLIRYGRGRIAVPNRRALEDLTCECYATVKAESDRLLPCRSVPSRHLVA